MAPCSRRRRARRRRVKKAVAETKKTWDVGGEAVGLERLLGAGAAPRFFEETWEVAPAVFPSACGESTLASLPDWGDVFEIFRVCEQGLGSGVAQALVFKDGAPSTAYASPAHAWLDASRAAREPWAFHRRAVVGECLRG